MSDHIASGPVDVEAIRLQVAAMVAEIKGIDASEIGDDTRLFSEDGTASLDFDSLDALEVAMAIEDRFALDLREEEQRDIDFRIFPTPRLIADYIVEHSPLFK